MILVGNLIRTAISVLGGRTSQLQNLNQDHTASKVMPCFSLIYSAFSAFWLCLTDQYGNYTEHIGPFNIPVNGISTVGKVNHKNLSIHEFIF